MNGSTARDMWTARSILNGSSSRAAWNVTARPLSSKWPAASRDIRAITNWALHAQNVTAREINTSLINRLILQRKGQRKKESIFSTPLDFHATGNWTIALYAIRAHGTPGS